jgi:hypothetical protein
MQNPSHDEEVPPPNQPSNTHITFTRSEFISFFSSDQASNPTPSPEDIADANRTFTVMLHWGTFKEISLGLYEMVPELVSEFPLRVFERFEKSKSSGRSKEGGCRWM